MKLNNKGITLVEIIISVALISIVLVFLFTLLIQVNNENSDNEVKSSYLVNQSTFIKQIEEDFLDFGLIEGYECSDYGVSVEATTGTTDANNLYLSRWDGTNLKCLTFNLTEEPKYAHIFLYKRKNTDDGKTILSYYRGDFKQSVELEDFDWTENTYSVTYDNRTYKTYSLPIIGPDSKDYSINLSYAS